MEYMNSSGKPLDIEALKKGAKARRPTRAAADAYHKGWVATGFPPAQLLDAQKQHQAAVERAAQTNRNMLPWDELRYMRDAKPTKVRSKPYETIAAAREAALLAERMGWKGCTFTEVSKGSVK